MRTYSRWLHSQPSNTILLCSPFSTSYSVGLTISDAQLYSSVGFPNHLTGEIYSINSRMCNASGLRVSILSQRHRLGREDFMWTRLSSGISAQVDAKLSCADCINSMSLNQKGHHWRLKDKFSKWSTFKSRIG